MLRQQAIDVRFLSDAAHSLITALAETVAHLQAMKAYGGNRNIAPFILNLRTSSRLLPALPGSCTKYEKAGWAPEPFWKFLSRKKFLASAGIRSPDRPACSLVTILT
jgi:hypothetical protein